VRVLWLLWQFVIVLAGGALVIGAVVGIWYGFSFVVLTLVGKLFRLRGQPPKD
jgi:hypothetical protein